MKLETCTLNIVVRKNSPHEARSLAEGKKRRAVLWIRAGGDDNGVTRECCSARGG